MNTTKAYIEIVIPIDSIQLKGNLRHAENSKGIILFSHGSGSSRLSPRNNYVAYYLLKHGFSSLLFDLLTQEEDTIYENRFNIKLLTDRLVKVTKWIRENSETKHLPIGYFGSSTGAASALSAAAQLDHAITAIVSRGGRPDLAMPVLNKINIPTLLLVGSFDDDVIKLNKEAQKEIRGICELKIIQGASHLFEERGKLEIVAKQTSDWFDLCMSEKK
jgi:pimeloyl-ACP methyl ester carboxylesterase